LTFAALLAAEAGTATLSDRLSSRCAAWFDAAASCVASGKLLPSLPTPAVVQLPPGSSPEQTARQALSRLEVEISHVAATPQ
jgi:hypothetical protein